MPETPLLREALARAMHGHFHREYDWPMEECGYHGNGHRMDADAILRALANDPEVTACVRGLLDRRLADLVQASFGGFAGDNYLDVAATDDAATLFGEPDD